jgi:hypothetical protein
MEPGFILDKSYGSNYVASPEWAEGATEQSIWTGVKMSGRERHPVITYRCVKCGFLESYALEE